MSFELGDRVKLRANLIDTVGYRASYFKETHTVSAIDMRQSLQFRSKTLFNISRPQCDYERVISLTLKQMRDIAKQNKLSDFHTGQKVTVVYCGQHTGEKTTIITVDTDSSILITPIDNWCKASSLYIHPETKQTEKKKEKNPVKQGTLDAMRTYRINQGQLGGKALSPVRVSNCQNYAFFDTFAGTTNVPLIRVHEKHLTCVTSYTDQNGIKHTAKSTKVKVTPEVLTAKVEENDEDSMNKLRAVAHTYVGTENIKRIESVKSSLLGKTEANIAEIAAIKAGVTQPRKVNWLAVGIGIAGLASTIAAYCI